MTKARLRMMETDMKNLHWEHEVLEQRFQKVFNTELCYLSTATYYRY